MHQLVASPIRGNIGELKNQVRVMCASAWSENQHSEYIALQPLQPGQMNGDTLVFSARKPSASLDISSLLPKAMRDDVIFKEFCHSGNTLLLNRKLEQLLTTLNCTVQKEEPYSGYIWQNTMRAINELENQTGIECNADYRKTVWLCLHYAMNNASEAQYINELTAITDYVSAKARLLALECLCLLKNM